MDDDKLDNIALLKHFVSEETKDLRPFEKFIAIAISKHRNNLSFKCCPGFNTLQKITGAGKATIKRAIDGLIAKQEIVRLRITAGNSYLRSQYYFLYDIEHAKQIYNNDESVFKRHHGNEVDSFEHCLSNRLF